MAVRKNLDARTKRADERVERRFKMGERIPRRLASHQKPCVIGTWKLMAGCLSYL